MPSDSQKTWAKRTNRARKMGKRRKRQLRHGSTPAFPINPEKAKEE